VAEVVDAVTGLAGAGVRWVDPQPAISPPIASRPRGVVSRPRNILVREEDAGAAPILPGPAGKIRPVPGVD
jgi:hypothetical protein